MSSKTFSIKKNSFLIAPFIIKKDSDVLIMATSLFLKELNNKNEAELSIVLGSLI